MSLNAKWSPMSWPCGPMELARAAASNNASPAWKKAVEGWAQPSALQLLKGAPVNCLIVEWASGTAGDQAQQQALQPLIAAGRALGLGFVGRISPRANLPESAAAAKAAGLEAVLIEGAVAHRDLDLPAILEFPRDSIDWDRATGIYSTTGNVWPEVNLPTMNGNTALGGPTGDPWVNSNGWFSLLARRMAPANSLWLSIDLPDAPAMLPVEKYCLAVADSRVYGARWILSLDPHLRAALLDGDAPALDAWKRIGDTLSFFERHAAWQTYEPMGVLAVVSDFTGQNAFMAGETLNLLSRHQTQFVILDRRNALSGPITRLKAVLWMDGEAPGRRAEPQFGRLCSARRPGRRPQILGTRGNRSASTTIGFSATTFSAWAKAESSLPPAAFPIPISSPSTPISSSAAKTISPGSITPKPQTSTPASDRTAKSWCKFSITPRGRPTMWLFGSSARAPGAKLLSPNLQASQPLPGISASERNKFRSSHGFR